MRLPLLLAACLPLCAADVLIVADEVPAMEVLARHLKSEAGLESTILKHPEIPKDLSAYRAMAVYVHRDLDETVAHAAQAYTEGGGKLVLLHHSISSAKRKNRDWFPFLGVQLPTGDVAQGGYKWLDPVEWELVNLAPGNPLTTRGVTYPEHTGYKGAQHDAIPLAHSEVYLNHVLTGPRTVLLGLKYRDAATGKTYEQDTAGWSMRAGKGTVMYFMAGHSAAEFDNPAYVHILVNAFAAR